jgi:hypothetical protein
LDAKIRKLSKDSNILEKKEKKNDLIEFDKIAKKIKDDEEKELSVVYQRGYR